MSLKVSVIVPVYNTEQYLDRCVKSIMGQSYTDIEIILVDDGSPDNAGALCDEFAKLDSRIKVIHKVNGGLSSARLAGFKESTGELIQFVDSDDYIHKEMIAKLVTAIESEDADLAMCSYFTDRFGECEAQLLPYNEKVITGKANIKNKYILPLIGFKNDEINIPGFIWIRMMRRNLIRESFFKSERVYYKEDHVFDLLYGENIEKIAIVNESLYYYCFNQVSLSNAYRKDKWKMYRNLYQFYEDFLEKNGYSAPERLKNYIFSSVFSTVDNAVLLDNYKRFKSEITQLFEDEIALKAINDYYHASGKTSRLTLVLLKKHLFRLLFIIRKSRISKK